VPEPHAAFELTMSDGAVIRVRRHGNPDGPRLVLCHGNGFAIDAYYPFWRHLTDRYDLAVYDQRNHGQNPRHQTNAHNIGNFVADMDRLLEELPSRFGSKPTAGAFHSISGITAIRHAQERGRRWDALVLFDPPLVPWPGHDLHEAARDFELGLSEWSAKRPNGFESPEALSEIFTRSKSLSGWVEGSHLLMAQSILSYESDADAWTLNCPPQNESQIYAENAYLNLTPRLGELEGPVKFICSDPDSAFARPPGLVNRAMHREFGHPYEAVSGTSHMLQLEQPEKVAGLVRAFLEGSGL
jgi:pimeloyl-ACP methyl ester carboxylesterase